MDALKRDEPVAWMVYTLDGQSVCVTDNPADFGEQHRALPLYTHPPRREQDDAEIAALRAEVERLHDLADKYKWQVRDTCVRAEKAEAEVEQEGAMREKVAEDLVRVIDRAEKAEAEVERLREEINLMRARVVYALSDDAAKKETT